MLHSKKEQFVPFLFLLPAFCGLVIFRLAPIMSSVLDSFITISYSGGPVKHFAGFANYTFALSDPVFLKSIKNTAVFSLIINPFEIIWAFILALLVYRPGKSMVVFRTIFFVPFTISLAITSTIWGIMYNPNGGLINSMLAVFHISPLGFLTSPKQALGSIIFLTAWRCIGYWMIFLISGLQNISASLYESAAIDGARAWQSFLYITLPMMKKTILFVIVAGTSQNFLTFTPVYILTSGGPENSTNILMYEAFRNVFIYADRGIGNAMVVIMILIMLIIVFGEFKFIKPKG